VKDKFWILIPSLVDSEYYFAKEVLAYLYW